MKYVLCLVLISVMCGCITQPKIEPTHEWEGHYYSFNELTNAIKNAELHNDESIWIMTNQTLKRLLKNTGR